MLPWCFDEEGAILDNSCNSGSLEDWLTIGIGTAPPPPTDSGTIVVVFVDRSRCCCGICGRTILISGLIKTKFLDTLIINLAQYTYTMTINTRQANENSASTVNNFQQLNVISGSVILWSNKAVLFWTCKYKLLMAALWHQAWKSSFFKQNTMKLINMSKMMVATQQASSLAYCLYRRTDRFTYFVDCQEVSWSRCI